MTYGPRHGRDSTLSSTPSTLVSLGLRVATKILYRFQRDSGITKEKNEAESARMFTVDNAWSDGQGLDNSHQKSDG